MISASKAIGVSRDAELSREVVYSAFSVLHNIISVFNINILISSWLHNLTS